MYCIAMELEGILFTEYNGSLIWRNGAKEFVTWAWGNFDLYFWTSSPAASAARWKIQILRECGISDDLVVLSRESGTACSVVDKSNLTQYIDVKPLETLTRMFPELTTKRILLIDWK